MDNPNNQNNPNKQNDPKGNSLFTGICLTALGAFCLIFMKEDVYRIMGLFDLSGKTMGIIGFGRIGKAVAAIAKAMGMQVLAYSRTPDPAGSPLAAYTDLDTLLAQSDVVSLHCPLTPAPNHLINAQTIAKMKDGALLLNTARGPVIDQQAVADALTQGKLRGVAMDVADQEPIPADAPLLTAPNCIITPHIAWAPLECRQRIMSITEASIRGFLSGQPVNTV